MTINGRKEVLALKIEQGFVYVLLTRANFNGGPGKEEKINFLLHAHALSYRWCLKACKMWQYETTIWLTHRWCL